MAVAIVLLIITLIQTPLNIFFLTREIRRSNEQSNLNHIIKQKEDKQAELDAVNSHYTQKQVQLNALSDTYAEKALKLEQDFSQQSQQLSQEIKLKEITNNELAQQIKVKEERQDNLLNEEAKLTMHIRELQSAQDRNYELLTSAFENFVVTLEHNMAEKEEEHDFFIEKLGEAYASQQAQLLQEVSKVREELDKMKSLRAAMIDAQLREEEIKNKSEFYMLQISDADKRDIAYLQSIEYNLREPRPLRMLIWSTFYRDKLNALAARQGAVNTCGIYKITYAGSNLAYIGQSKNIKERWAEEIKEGLGIDTKVTNTRAKFMREKGVHNFTFEVLDKCSPAELNERERHFIEMYQTYDFGLNSTKGNK